VPIQIEGRALRLRGGRELVLPPLTVRTVRKFTKDGRLSLVMAMAGQQGLPTDDQWQALVDLMTEALRDNYPDITPDEVEGLVDWGTLSMVIEALFSSSGFKPVPPGEALSPLTGTAS
jgi:hypothetical protein